MSELTIDLKNKLLFYLKSLIDLIQNENFDEAFSIVKLIKLMTDDNSEQTFMNMSLYFENKLKNRVTPFWPEIMAYHDYICEFFDLSEVFDLNFIRHLEFHTVKFLEQQCRQNKNCDLKIIECLKKIKAENDISMNPMDVRSYILKAKINSIEVDNFLNMLIEYANEYFGDPKMFFNNFCDIGMVS